MTALPSASHERKLLAVGEALRRQGHDVVFAGRELRAEEARRRGLSFVRAGLDGFPSTSMDQSVGQLDRQAMALCELTRASLADLRDVVADFRPHLVVRDFSERGGFLLADKVKIPWVSVACTSVAPLSKPSSAFARDGRYWLNVLRAEIGLAPISSREGESPFVTLCFRPRVFFKEDRPLLRSARLVRHVNDVSRKEEAEAVLARGSGAGPLVLAAVGTILAEENAEQVRAIVDGSASAATVVALGRSLSAFPFRHRVLAVDDGPQEALIPMADAVVCHGGMNTTIEVLSEGVPIVVVSSYEEAAYVGRRCEALGVGKHVALSAVDDPERAVRAAVEQVLHDPSFRARAREFARENAKLPDLSEVLAEICRTVREEGALPAA